MQNKLLQDRQKKIALEKAIKNHSLDAHQRLIVDYLKIRFNSVLTRWMAGVEQADPERLRGEAACLKDLIQILSNAQLEQFIEGDTE